ncbi:MAG: hypothetical protein RJA19_1901 [Bacteroidota bacterium]|jgi:hydrogenase/urease accessory protein HupE
MREWILGLEHITDLGGYDHMLYLLALVAFADLRQSLRLVGIVTAFTVGHSLTLLLAGLNLVQVPGDWVEFLIPLTIFLTAALQARRDAQRRAATAGVYAITVAFGLIHGLGFSSFFRIMSEPGASILMPLLRFNLGVESGQILILLVLLSLASLSRRLGVQEREQQLVVCGAAMGISLLLMAERWPA